MRVRVLVATGVATVVLGAALAQSPAPVQLDARASDPKAMGCMVGAPPPAAKVIRFADGSDYKFPQTRWAFAHMRELGPTPPVSRGSGPVSELPRAERTDLDAVTFIPIGGAKPMTWAATETCFTSESTLHEGHARSGASENFCSASNSWPQDEQRYS